MYQQRRQRRLLLFSVINSIVGYCSKFNFRNRQMLYGSVLHRMLLYQTIVGTHIANKGISVHLACRPLHKQSEQRYTQDKQLQFPIVFKCYNAFIYALITYRTVDSLLYRRLRSGDC